MLAINLLKNARLVGSKLIAQCPACAERGGDSLGNHLCVFDQGRGAYHCIADDEGSGGEHNQRIFELAGLRGRQSAQPAPAPRRLEPPMPKPAPHLPPLRPLRVGEKVDIGIARGWVNMRGVYELCDRRMLLFGEVFDDGQTWPSWVITDSSRRNAQARRLDGKPWSGINAKAKTLRNCAANWPIGAADILDRPLVLLCEGQPDFCAALTVAAFEGLPVDEIAPVCAAGAGLGLHLHALPYFAGKRVRIYAHPDETGIRGARYWMRQLATVGAATDIFVFQDVALPDGRPVKDLADFATLIRPGASLPRAMASLFPTKETNQTSTT